MGKASRLKKQDDAPKRVKVAPVPFARRPFEGLPGETDWVALQEILPAATATVRLRPDAVPSDVPAAVTEDGPVEVTIATVLPLAWPAIRRQDGRIIVGAQHGSRSGDASRDLAGVILAALATEPGAAVSAVPAPTAQTPRLQDLLDTSVPLEVTVHEGFDFWVDDADLDEDAQESLSRANESIVPTVALAGTPSAYWCRIGARTYIRLVLGEDEGAATDALARLHAAGADSLGADSKLLGAFRSGGLLVPVIEVPADAEPATYEAPVAEFAQRYRAALAETAPLTADERRAKSGLLSRQLTLR